jgi:transcriptional regulator with XRE-family HTH domain
MTNGTSSPPEASEAAFFNLESVLKGKSCSKYRLAKMLGVTPAEVFRWAKPSSNPTMQTLCRIASVLDVSLDELVKYNRAGKGT